MMDTAHSVEEADLIAQLKGVHTPDEACKEACVIHNPSAGPHRQRRLHWRDDRKIFERICEHGVGHPDPDQFPYWETLPENYDGLWDAVHGCDGCCRDLVQAR